MKQEPALEKEYNGLIIKIFHDDDPATNPVNMLGTQVYWHNRYILGHEQPKESPMEYLSEKVGDYLGVNNWDVNSKKYIEWDEHKSGMIKFLWDEFEKKNVIIPVYAYEHGGITISATGKHAGWDSFDSGQLGFVYVAHDDIKKSFGKKKITKKLLERAEKCLIAEVEGYDDYITGNVYGYVIEDEAGEELDSCWGFIGDYDKFVLDEAEASADFYSKEIAENKKNEDKRMKEL